MNEIIYLDSAATMQKPESVIAGQVDFLRKSYANAGRGICARSAAVDAMVGDARRAVAEFMGAAENQIVFTSGATDGLNRVVRLIGGGHLRVAVSDLDHHSARLPWQMRRDTQIVLWPLDTDFNLAASPVADVYVLTAMSNVMGGAQDVEKIVRAIRNKNSDAIVVVDAAQYVVHEKIDAKSWEADFVCWSGHKIGADTGVGVMYVKNPQRWSPDVFGGGMVRRILDNEIIFSDGSDLFEAGTLPLTQIAGLPAAISELENGRPDLNLIKYLYDELSQMSQIKILTQRSASLLTFVVHGMHVLDFGALMGAYNICVRVGNMCASWMMKALSVDGVVRISVGPQNTMDDMRKVIDVIKKIVK